MPMAPSAIRPASRVPRATCFTVLPSADVGGGSAAELEPAGVHRGDQAAAGQQGGVHAVGHRAKRVEGRLGRLLQPVQRLVGGDPVGQVQPRDGVGDRTPLDNHRW